MVIVAVVISVTGNAVDLVVVVTKIRYLVSQRKYYYPFLDHNFVNQDLFGGGLCSKLTVRY